MNKTSVTFKLVEPGVGTSIKKFANKRKLRVKDISGKLKVIEMKFASGKNSFYVQMIFNPWAHKDVPPIVELVNIIYNGEDGSFFSIMELNGTEGRYRLQFDEDLKKKWKQKNNIMNMWSDFIVPAIEEMKPNINYRNLELSPGAWDLVFPRGVKIHLQTLEKIAKKNNWELLDEEASDIYRQKAARELETARLQEKAKIEEFKLKIEKAESIAEIEEIESFYGSKFIQELENEDLERLAKRREKLQPVVDEPIKWDDDSYTQDTSMGGSRRGAIGRRRRI